MPSRAPARRAGEPPLAAGGRPYRLRRLERDIELEFDFRNPYWMSKPPAVIAVGVVAGLLVAGAGMTLGAFFTHSMPHQRSVVIQASVFHAEDQWLMPAQVVAGGAPGAPPRRSPPPRSARSRIAAQLAPAEALQARDIPVSGRSGNFNSLFGRKCSLFARVGNFPGTASNRKIFHSGFSPNRPECGKFAAFFPIGREVGSRARRPTSKVVLRRRRLTATSPASAP